MLKCLIDFNQNGIIARKGDTFNGDSLVENYLLDSWPGYWEKAQPVKAEPVVSKTVVVEAPAVDKAVKAPAKKIAR